MNKKKYRLAVLATILALLLPSVGFAQVGEHRNTFSVGVNVGMDFNQISFEPTIQQKFHTSPSIGLSLRYVCEKYFSTICAIQVEINYARLGWNEEILDNKSNPLPDTYQRDLHYVQIPFLARLGWGREQKGFQFYVLAGPQVGYCFKEKEVFSDTWTVDASGNPIRPNGMYAQYGMSLDHKFDYGISAGLGVEWSTSIGHFNFDGRYYYGLSDVFGNSKKDVFSRSANGTIMGKLTYFIDL